MLEPQEPCGAVGMAAQAPLPCAAGGRPSVWLAGWKQGGDLLAGSPRAMSGMSVAVGVKQTENQGIKNNTK